MSIWSSPPSDSALLLAELSSLMNCSFGRAGVFALRTGSSIFSCNSHVQILLHIHWHIQLHVYRQNQLHIHWPGSPTRQGHMQRGGLGEAASCGWKPQSRGGCALTGGSSMRSQKLLCSRRSSSSCVGCRNTGKSSAHQLCTSAFLYSTAC